MQATAGHPAESLVSAALRGELTDAQARRLARQGAEIVILALLAASKRIAEQEARITEQNARIAEQNARITEQNTRLASLQVSATTPQPTPSTPSAMVPVYTKPSTTRRRKKPGAREGHPGTRRSKPTRIDERREHRLTQCPDCGGPLNKCRRARTRIIEDIPEEITPVVTEHTIHRDFCPKCKKHVEPVVPDALPNATLGHHVVSLTSWFHYGLGVTLAQTVDILGYHLQTRLTPGGLIHMWRRLAVILEPWYRQIAEAALRSSHLHADETGWRVSGQTQWLWCFANAQVCYYMIDRSRGGPALQKFFTESFEGVLITDFWRAYDGVCADGRQFCLVHLLRELEKVDERNAPAGRETVNPRAAADTDSPLGTDSWIGTGRPLGTDHHGTEWRAFAKKLRRLIRDAIRLRKRPDFTNERYWSRIVLIHKRLDALAAADYENADARRLAKRLLRTCDHLWTFLDEPDIPFDNNFAERMIRPAVILRKNSQSNRSEQGAATQAVLMSIYRTLKLQGLNPTKTIAQALKTYLTTSQLPTLPQQTTANG